MNNSELKNSIALNEKSKRVLSFSIKVLTVTLVLFCVVLGGFLAVKDGYKNWTTRLLYYTFQSNVWIAIAQFLALIFCLRKKDDYLLSVIYRVRFVFVTSILMTMTVFYIFLAPFAKGIINVWSPISVVFHGIVPILTIIDFILDEYKVNLTFKDCFLTLIPPIVYYTLAIILCYIKLDFGLGTPYPYLFLDVYSPAGMFGVSFTPYFFPGTFYWLIFFGTIMFIISIILKRINNNLKRP